MHNKVVTMAARALRECGAKTIRFNFRGAGQSAGTFDEGQGEADDLRAVVAYAREKFPGHTLWLGGFSFGAYVSYKCAHALKPGLLLSIAPPVGRSWNFDGIPHPNCPWIVIQGEDDEIVDAQAVKAWVATLQPQPEFVSMPDTSHFFHRKLMDLRGAIKIRRAPVAAGPGERMSTLPNPSAAYAAGVARGEWQDDAAQHPALRELDRLHDALRAPVDNGGLLSRLFGNDAPEAPRGLYLWGGVGRGKTFLIDLFYDGLPIAEKRRTHFHRFMREVHEGLRAHTGERDPLSAIAKQWRETLRVIVLDEFFVSDIGDAMLLGAPARAPVRRGRGARDQFERRARRPVQGRPAARALPARDQADRSPLRRRVPRQPARLPPARAHAFAGVSRAAGCASRRRGCTNAGTR